MCDQTEVQYLDGDVVWVKIGPLWWPGVVKDLEKEEDGAEILAGLKKKPIATVKFFDEENYEFVRNLDQIYHYSCRRKDEFIKKGLDKFRAGAQHMKKFPSDVTKAETLVNGDVNIINDPKFFPEEKQNYDEIFGSGKKKSKKEKEISPTLKSRASSSRNSTPYRPITHQRFINKVLHGHSDHKVRTLIQPISSPEESFKNSYKCHMCKFETTRVNVIVAHHRLSHSPKNSVNWTGSDSKIIRRRPAHKARKIKVKKLVEASIDESSDDETLEVKKKQSSKAKRSPKQAKSPVKTKEGATASPAKTASSPTKRKVDDEEEDLDQKKPRYTDVLLADWSEDEDDEDKKNEAEEVGDSKENLPDEGDDETEKTEDVESKESEDVKEDENNESNENIENIESIESEEPTIVIKGSRKKQNEKMSCFDFDEEEEGFIGMSNANTYGRKIPRVIPVKDKSDLGVDLEIEELFKRKSESDPDEPRSQDESDVVSEKEIESEKFEEKSDETETDKKEEDNKNQSNPQRLEKATKRRRKSSKDQEKKTAAVNVEDSLAMRRARRPGAKKSYLNEVIEKIEDFDEETEKKKHEESRIEDDFIDFTPKRRIIVKEEVGSGSSRRKQDLKVHALDNDREEVIYSEIVGNEQKIKFVEEPSSKKAKSKQQSDNAQPEDDLTSQIDHLLAETSVPHLPPAPPAPEERTEISETASTKVTSFSLDYVQSEQSPKKVIVKPEKREIKSISRMFSDSLRSPGSSQEAKADTTDDLFLDEGKGFSDIGAEEQKKTLDSPKSRDSPVKGSPRKRGAPLVLSSLPRTIETSGGQVTVLPIIKTTSPANEGSCVVLPGGKKVDIKKIATDAKLSSSEEGSKESEGTPRLGIIKTFKIKQDSLPTSLLASGKLKGQTIVHQKGGKYVIVPQPSQAARQKIVPGKIQPQGKVVILTNQHGEQKIITTSGLQQSKFKIDSQKIIASPDSVSDKSMEIPSTSGLVTLGKSQPVIKMVPDGKGGIMKQLTVSPKKVVLGGTKVLLSGSNVANAGQGNTIQKITLPSTTNLGGDFRLIENYKGSGKTVLIQGNPNPAANLVFKTSAAAPRQAVSRVVQSPQNILSLKKTPKILMRTSSKQNEFVVHSSSIGTSSETPTYVMKRQGADGKFAAQKIIRSQIVSPKIAPSGSGSKTFFLTSGQTTAPKGDSIIIKSSPESMSNKIVRIKQKVKSPEIQVQKSVQRIVQKAPETFSIGQNNLLLTSELTQHPEPSETAQIVQIQAEQPQQPVLQTQVMAMPGPVGADGNQTYVLLSVDEHGVVQTIDNSIIAYDASAQNDQVFINPPTNNNVILINPQSNEEFKPVYSSTSQDILAEALANTNVLEGTISSDIEPVMPSILLPPSIPASVVQETSITLQKPIMTPLEIPSSVVPDTSGLEPPPLPPTPTDEDVLMEDQDEELQMEGLAEPQLINNEQMEEGTSGEAADVHDCLDGGQEIRNEEFNHFENVENPGGEPFHEEEYKAKNGGFDESAKQAEGFRPEERTEAETENGQFYQREEYPEDKASEEFENQPPREDFIIENSQEGQGANSFQSMPLLNDEPDTSDDAQGSEPIGDQDAELQKSRIENGDFSPLLREQEPPSSTNNDIVTESNYEGHEEARYETYQGYQDCSEEEPKSRELESREEQNDEEIKEKDSLDGRETQSMPVISDEAHSYEMEPLYSDVMSQKRFQEETEVTSTTDEFSNKDNAV